MASIAAIAVPLTLALAVVALVGLVAGAPDDTKDIADPQHLGPRLVVVVIGLLVLVGLELGALSSRRWWVRALALPLGIVLALVLVGLVEGVAGEPEGPAGFDSSLGLGGNQLLIRVAPAPALPVVPTDAVAVAHQGEVDIYTLVTAEDARPDPEGVEELTRLLDLEGAEGLGIDDGTDDTQLGELLAAVGQAQEEPVPPVEPGDRVVVVHGDEGDTVEVGVPSVAAGELPENTVDRLIQGGVALERLGYEVELVLPAGTVDVQGGSSGWSDVWQDVGSALGQLRWLVFPIVGLLAAFLVVGLVRRRGPAWVMAPVPEPPPEADPEATRDRIAAALDQALDDLPLEGDPRSVIAAAYLRMTTALSEHGVERRPSDTPLEYLARALEQLDASSHAVHRLTDLLQIAMFSDRPVEPTMAQEAVSAFTQVRDELRSPAWV